MNNNLDHIKNKLLKFNENINTMPDSEIRLGDFLLSEIISDLHEKNIQNFGCWLKYYSTDGNNFNEIISLIESYYNKTSKGEFDNISIDEKIMIYNAIGLYCVEMDVEKPTGKILGIIISTFIEIIRQYNLLLLGYLHSVSDNILISDRDKCRFYTI